MQKIKRKGVLLSLVAAFALCFGVRKVDAEADAPPLTSANFTALCGDLVQGATTLEELIPAARKGTAVDEFHMSDQVTLSFGGKMWTAVYLSESENGDVLLTLWLSPDEASPPLNWSAYLERNPSPESDIPSNLYSFSYIRSYLCGTPYKDPNEQITNESAQDETWADFLHDFDDYLVAPEEVPYQKTQSARTLFGKDFDLLNESYGEQFLQFDYSLKEGYFNWKEDKLFLPSVSEIGESPNTGIWKTTKAQRATDENNFYWLRSAEVEEDRSRTYNLNSYYVFGEDSLCNSIEGDTPYRVRPAIHLNLTKAAPTKSSPDLPTKPEDSMLHAQKEYDGTPLSLPIAHADLLSVSSMTDGANFTLSKDGTGTFSATDAGKYELAVLPTDGTWSDGTNEPAVYTLFISRTQKTLTAKWTVCDEAGEDDGKFLFTGMKEYSAQAIYNGKILNEIPAECIQASLFDQDGNVHGELSFTLKREGGKNIGEEMRMTLELENMDKNVEWTVTEASKRFTVDMIKRPVSIKLKTGLDSVYGEPLLRPEACFEYAEDSLKIFETDGDVLALTGIGERANAGEYEVQLALQAAYAERYELTCEGGRYTVLRRKCDTGAVFALEKEYDGTTEAVLDVSQLSLTGTVEGDDVTVHANGVFDEKDAGERTVFVTLSLSGEDADNYLLEAYEYSLSARIFPRKITVEIGDASSVYGKATPEFSYRLAGGMVIAGDELLLEFSLDREAKTAGRYEISAVCGNPNYAVTVINGTYTIYKAKIEVPIVEDLIYNGEEQKVRVDESIYTVEGSGKDVGEYEAVLRLKNSTNYEFTSGEAEVRVQYKILPYAVTVQIDDASSVYGKPIAKLSYSLSNELFGDDDLGISLLMDGMNAGTYAITGKWTNHNYTVTFINGTYTIYKAKVEIPSVEDLVYNGTEQFVNVDETFFLVEGRAKDVGEYEAVLRLKDSTNYEFEKGAVEVKVQYIILPYAVTVRIDNASSSYGEPIAKLTYTLSNELFGDDDLNLFLYVKGMNAGTYAIEGTWKNKNYDVSFEGGIYTILKAKIDIPTVEDLIYNGEMQKGKVDDSIFTVEGSAKDVGVYEAILKLKDSTNYEFTSGEAEVIVKYKILPYAVTVRIENASSVYGAPIAKLGYTLLGKLFCDDELGVSLRMDGVNAGTYAITGIWTNHNYAVTFINGTYTIYQAQIEIPSVEDLVYNGEKQKVKVDETFFSVEGRAKDVGTYEAVLRLKDSINYEFEIGGAEVKVQYKILPYAVTVKIKDATSVYGKPIVELGFTILDKLFGDDDLEISLHMDGVNAGTYAITGIWTNQNYQVTFINGTYTIYKAQIEIPTVEDLIYNGEAQKIKVDETVYAVEGCARDVGEHEVILRPKDSKNYEFETGEETIKIKYKILPYSVTVKIDNASSFYGEPIAKLNYTLSNELFGDDDLGLFLYVKGMNAGIYEIEGSWKNNNYDVTFEGGIYTILKATIDIPSIEDLIYNREAQKVKVDETIYSVEGRAKDVGEHEAIIKIKDSVNYEFATGTAEIKVQYRILPYAVTVQIENASSVYGEPLAKINYTILDEIFGDDDLGIKLTINGVNAGTYAIEGSWANQNYTVTFISGSYTIHKAQNDWADGFDLKTWLQSGDFTYLPSTKFGEAQIEVFLDASCTKKFEGDIQNAPPGRYFLHFFVPQSENFEGFDEVVPFLVKFTDLLSDESSKTEPSYSDRANFPHFELILSAGALSFLLTAVYAAKARRNHHQEDENQDGKQ